MVYAQKVQIETTKTQQAIQVVLAISPHLKWNKVKKI